MKNPLCPYCNSDDCVVERPFWHETKRELKILTNGFCCACGKNFDVIADIDFHKSLKVKQFAYDNRDGSVTYLRD